LTVATASDTDRYTELTRAMQTIDIAQGDQLQLFRALAGLLFLGNIDFVPDLAVW